MPGDRTSSGIPAMNRCAYVVHDSRGGDRRCTRLSCHTGPCDYEPERDPEDCPHCGKRVRDIWDHEWQGDEDEWIHTECGSCEKPIILHRHCRVTYEVTDAV